MFKKKQKPSIQSAHPFFVIYQYGGKGRVAKYDTHEEAQSVIKENDGANGYYMLGIFNFNTREYEDDGLEHSYDRRQLLYDYVYEEFPTEDDLAKRIRQNRESLQRVIRHYIKMFGIVLVTLAVFGYCNYWLGIQINSALGTCLAALFYSGGTLGYLVDWHIKTFGGKTAAEKVSEWTLVISYILGTAFTALSVSF